jgi:predicted O-linked N-acetylglucosamine transferase (SPINDLY family)
MSINSMAFGTAVAYQKAGRTDEAAEIYQRILREKPDFTDARFNLAALLASRDALDEALDQYVKILEVEPDNASALTNIGNVYQKQGHHDKARDNYLRSVGIDDTLAESHLGLGNALLSLGEVQGAIVAFQQALGLNDELAPVHNNLGVALMAVGRTSEAKQRFERSLELNPMAADAHNNYATLLSNNDAFEPAVLHFDAAAKLAPEWVQPRTNRAAVLCTLKRWDDALVMYREAVAINPDDVSIYSNYPGLLIDQKLYDEAKTVLDHCRALAPDNSHFSYLAGNLSVFQNDYDKAIGLYLLAFEQGGESVDLHANFVKTLVKLDQIDEANLACDDAVKNFPDSAEIWNAKGSCEYVRSNYDEALTAFEKAVELDGGLILAQVNVVAANLNRGDTLQALSMAQKCVENFPDSAHAYAILGLAYHSMEQHDNALEAYDKASELDPENIDALHNKAATLHRTGRHDDAIKLYYQALKVDPKQDKTYFNLGSIMQSIDRHKEAISAFDKALEIRPDYLSARAYMAHSLMYECMWDNLSSVSEAIIDGTRQEIAAHSDIAASPFSLLAISAPGDVRLAAARQVCKSAERSVKSVQQTLTMEYPEARGEKMRIGYISADFRRHSASRAFTEVLTSHDRNKFEIFGYSSSIEHDDLTDFFAENFDHFVSHARTPYAEAAKSINEDQLHILVDLSGHTKGVRFEVLALQPAPVQVHFLGYAKTVGADFIQYLISDKYNAPDSELPFYGEKLAYLPYNSLPASRPGTAARAMTRSEAGLPDEGFVFANFNSHYKFDPDIFAAWMRILRRADGSVLWLLNTSDNSAENLKKIAEIQGVSPDRIIFAPYTSHAKHLARLPLADLGLDTKNHAGGVTTTDALWAGVPVLTLSMSSMIDHMGASLMHAANLPELVADSIDSFVGTAVTLAGDADQFREVREKLRAAHMTAPLFDTPGFTRYLENAYEQMWQRHADGLAPGHILVNPDVHRNDKGASSS